MKPLTNVQQEILTYIKTYISEVGYSPSFKDIKEHRGYKSENAVRDHLISLTKKGYINTTDGVPRSIVVLTENNGWISVKDKMPDDDAHYYDTVLVYCEYEACKECDVAYSIDNGVFISEESGKKLPVTHWQPLPQPPSR